MGSIILMGIKHCGKSTQGRLLSQELSIPFFDTDEIIEHDTGMSAREIYAVRGVNAFMDAEVSACKSIVSCIASDSEKNDYDAVIATGGGICNNTDAIAVLRPIGTFVFLVAPEKVAADRIVREARIGQDGKISNLPAYIANKNPESLEDVRALFHAFYEERIKIYADIADVSVDMDSAPKFVNMRRIISAVRKLEK